MCFKFFSWFKPNYQPIVDYVEGRMSIVDFQKMFNKDTSLRNLLKKPMSKTYQYMRQYDFKVFFMLLEDYSFVKHNWNTISNRFGLQGVLMDFLESRGVSYKQYVKYEQDYDVLIFIQPSWVDVVDDTLDKIVYEIPKDLSKAKQIAWGKQRVKELFRYDKSYPRWIQGAEWPIVNGKPLVFSHQERVKGEDWRVLYYFYDPYTKEQTVVEQFT